MIEEIDKRFIDLLSEGQRLFSSLPHDGNEPEFWVQEHRIVEYQKWITSTVNLIKLIDRSNGVYYAECDKILKDKEIEAGIPTRVVQKIFGLLQSAYDDWKKGFLRKIEHIIIAEAFDDFLDYASEFHKGNKKIESSILSSIVLEDTIKRIARKNRIDTQGKSLELLIDELIKADIFTPVKGKRIKGFSAVRNQALHAEWESFDIRDVGELINGLREIIENYL